jgi:hypothetical protein
MSNTSTRVADMGAILGALDPLTAGLPDPQKRRQLVADFCRLMGSQVGFENAARWVKR